MIKEFWQEQREEKKRQKQIKKQHKKASKTKEQTAYKVFGVLLTLFIIFGACMTSGMGSTGDVDWGDAIGFTDEIIAELSAPVDSNLILVDGRLSNSDWQDVQSMFIENNLNIVKANELDMEALTSDKIQLSTNMSLSSSETGALIYRLIEDFGFSEEVELLSCYLYVIDNVTYLRTVSLLDLTAVVSAAELPTVYVTTTSRLRILDDSITVLKSNVKLNLIEESRNDELVELINKSSFLEICYYTNTHCANQLNLFADMLKCKIKIDGANISFITK